jgi:hypothetical protein
MPIDPAGTTPGIVSENQEPETISVKCPRGGCDSQAAVEIKVAAPEYVGRRMYRCVKCGHTWGLAVGGQLNI